MTTLQQSSLPHNFHSKIPTFSEPLSYPSVDVNQPDHEGCTALHHACFSGSLEYAILLLDRGADINHRDVDGATPLHKCSYKGHLQIVTLLLTNKRFSHNHLDQPDSMGYTPLHRAVDGGHKDTVHILLCFGSNPSSTDSNLSTPLHKSAKLPSHNILEELLLSGANPSQKDKTGATALHVAAYNNRTESVRLLLLARANVDARLKDTESTPLHLAAYRGHGQIVKLLLEFDADVAAVDKIERTALHLAVGNTSSDCVKLLLEYGASPSSLDSNGRTPLSYCRLFGTPPGVTSLLEMTRGRPSSVRLFGKRNKTFFVVGRDGNVNNENQKNVVLTTNNNNNNSNFYHNEKNVSLPLISSYSSGRSVDLAKPLQFISTPVGSPQFSHNSPTSSPALVPDPNPNPILNPNPNLNPDSSLSPSPSPSPSPSVPLPPPPPSPPPPPPPPPPLPPPVPPTLKKKSLAKKIKSSVNPHTTSRTNSNHNVKQTSLFHPSLTTRSPALQKASSVVSNPKLKPDSKFQAVKSTTAISSTTFHQPTAITSPVFEDPKKREEIEKHANLDRYGFLRNSSEPSNEPSAAEKEKQVERTKKWNVMVKHWAKYSKQSKLKERVAKGIPECLRGLVWRLLAERAIEDQIDTLKSSFNYKDLTERETSEREQIERDIGRTFPGHIFFQRHDGQAVLANALRAYSVHNPAVGYCQGMGFICALLLMYMTEEDSFWVMKIVLENYEMSGLLMPGLPKLQLVMFTFDRLLRHNLPKMHRHLAEYSIETTMYAPQWFITIYIYNMPFPVVLRIWDLFLYYGFSITYSIALALFKMFEEKILSMTTFEDIMTFLKFSHNELRNTSIRIDPDELVRLALHYRLKPSKIQQIQAEFEHT